MIARRVSSFTALSILTLLHACSATSSDATESGDNSTGSGSNAGSSDGTGSDDSNPSQGSIDGSGATTDPDAGEGTDANICASYTAVSEPKVPLVYILLDQSGSMKEPRWSHAKEALGTASASLEQFADVGFIGFPTHPISSDQDPTQSCAAQVKVAPGGTSAEISGSLEPTAPTMGHTPVRAALDLAASELANATYAERPKYVVLITDGTPNCAQGEAAYIREDPTDAVVAMAAAGITTFVVGYQLGNSVVEGINPTVVANNMAAAGGTTEYRDVVDGSELTAELEEIRKEVVPCDFELDEAPRGGASYVRVTIDDVDYAYQSEWTLVGEKTVSLNEGSTACTTLRDGENHKVNIQVECEPVQIR